MHQEFYPMATAALAIFLMIGFGFKYGPHIVSIIINVPVMIMGIIILSPFILLEIIFTGRTTFFDKRNKR